jgi:hypothetical protein
MEWECNFVFSFRPFSHHLFPTMTKAGRKKSKKGEIASRVFPSSSIVVAKLKISLGSSARNSVDLTQPSSQAEKEKSNNREHFSRLVLLALPLTKPLTVRLTFSDATWHSQLA